LPRSMGDSMSDNLDHLPDTRDPADLLSEIEEELLDVCGWSFVLWCRLHRLRVILDGSDVKEGQSCQR